MPNAGTEESYKEDSIATAKRVMSREQCEKTRIILLADRNTETEGCLSRGKKRNKSIEFVRNARINYQKSPNTVNNNPSDRITIET